MKKKINKYKYHKKKINIEETIEKRYKILVILIIAIMSLLLSTLFYVQIIRNKHYSDKLTSLTVNIIQGDSSPRGRIYDRNGNIIVDNQSIKTIYYKKPNKITTKKEIETAYKVAEYIDVDYTKLTEKMLKNFWILNNKEESKKRITDEEWEDYENRKLTSDDIEELKLQRVTEEDIAEYDEKDKEACYIYNLMNKGYYYTEKTIKNKDVTDEEYAKIAENINTLPGFNVKLDWERYYPYGNTFKTILGSVSSSSSGIPYNLKEYYLEKGYTLTDRVGTSYIEYQYEAYLKGIKATYQVNSDGSYTELTKGSRGNDIVLTIDINLQQAVEQILEEELVATKKEKNTQYFDKSYVIINDPNTGEILAMAGKQIVVNEDGSYSIYDYTPGVITGSVTPGSIVKGASHIVGYNTGALTIGEVRKDECIKIAATPIKCSFRNYGNIDDLAALKYSSNVYQFYTAIKVGKGNYKYNKPLKIDESAFDTYRDTFAQFGLGIKTGIDLPNESLGYKGSNRLSGLLLDFSIGQYDTYTPIQISQYMSTIANNGVRMQPYLLKAVFDSNEESLTSIIYETESKKLNKVDTEDKYLQRVQEGFKQVLSPGGTGAAYIDYRYNAAGKTGTAQSFLDTDGDGTIDTATTTATFAAYAPYDNPEVVFTVISPDVAPEDVTYNNMSRVNTRISQKVSKKYFEIYR
ncbi:MAG: penicillin-binding protein 2 [Firmicutes bacterium]|nr:penicillin-binding protein 2 [Bacillota bacterium]